MPNRYERACGYSFRRLSKDAKERALKDEREHIVDFNWWEGVYEDAKRMGALIGIEIDQISFSGFWSQGDGACFDGRYSHKAGAVEAITAECDGQDAELIRIASELTVLQSTWRLLHGFTFECTVHAIDRHYSHSGTMQTGYAYDEERYQVTEVWKMDRAVERLLRAFADWIYHQLEAEYEHLVSDEVCTERLMDSGLRFDSSGAIL